MIQTFEGVQMNYRNPDWIFSDTVFPKTGVVVHEKTDRGEAGMGMEPSGHWFMNYREVRVCSFHPYDGSAPVPCEYPHGYRTRQLTRR